MRGGCGVRGVRGMCGARARDWRRRTFILSEYFSSMFRLKTVVRRSPCFGLPSPELITTSKAKTSFFSIVASATCWSFVCTLMIVCGARQPHAWQGAEH